MSLCNEHSGFAKEIESLKKEDNEIWGAIDSLRKENGKIWTALNTRLPLWATFLIAFLSSISTWGLTH